MNIRLVKKKIKSVKNVRKITKAMQMVSAVKMRKAQELEVESRPYRDGLTEMIGKLSGKVDPSQAEIMQVDTTEAKKEIVVVFASNKGLAGAFNISVFRHTLKEYPSFNNIDIVTVGAKATQFFGRMKGAHILADFSGNNLLLEYSALFDFLLEKYKTGEYRKISLVFTQFVSTLKSFVVSAPLLPLSAVDMKQSEGSDEKKSSNQDVVIEPSAAEILEQLLLSFLEYKVRGAIISSEAVEHSARMMAMKSATDNATEIIYNMTLLSNKLRQEKITNELLDMITAKESVEG
ncbi:MAG: ATP synthase F1 subunit gamma [bacterium]|nr:ATP synthase F1 subunit gamma [bacterium]